MINPINSLANMEYSLYGGASGWNANCPSYANGYYANQNFYNSSPYNYNYLNNFTPNTNFNWTNQTPSSDIFTAQNSISKDSAAETGLTKKDLDTLGEYYLKGLEPSESLLGAAGGGAAFGIVNNTRFIAHPWNSFSTIRTVDKMFAGIKDKNSNIYKLWKNGETRQLVMDAYARMHKLEGGSKWRAGLFKARINPNEPLYQNLKQEMERAIASGDKKALAEATEKIRIATNTKTGYIPKLWNKIKVSCGGKQSATIAEKLANTGAIDAAVTKNIAEKSTSSLMGHLKHEIKGQGVKGGLLMLGIEFLLSWDNIKSAFKEDSGTGMKQLGQTATKGAGSLVGWTVGQAAGAWAGAKIGALAGSAIAPGVGTAIGAIAGLIGGSIGCALMGKVTKSLVGEDVGAKAKVEAMKTTKEGQQELLTMTAQQAQEDKNLDEKVLNIFRKISAA